MAKKSSTGSRGLDGSKIVGVVLALLVVGMGLTTFLILPSLRREISEIRIILHVYKLKLPFAFQTGVCGI